MSSVDINSRTKNAEPFFSVFNSVSEITNYNNFVDTLGFESATMILVMFELDVANTNAELTLRMQHSDEFDPDWSQNQIDSAFSDVPEDFYTCDDASATIKASDIDILNLPNDGSIINRGYLGSKRYIRYGIKSTGATIGQNSFAMYTLLSKARKDPALQGVVFDVIPFA